MNAPNAQDITDNEVYIWFIAILRILVLVMSAALSGMLVQYWWMYRDRLRTSQVRGIIVLLIATGTALLFTLLVLTDAKPEFPGSLVAGGYLAFLIGLTVLFFDPDNRKGPQS